MLFESYRLNSSTAELWNSYFYPDNRFNVAPKLVAEADRGDGFQVLSLGYAEGPVGQMSHDTLAGRRRPSAIADLIEDIRVTQELVGFRHYLTSASIALVNTFVRDHEVLTDTAAAGLDQHVQRPPQRRLADTAGRGDAAAGRARRSSPDRDR